MKTEIRDAWSELNTQYQDFLLRCNLSDTGAQPPAGNLCVSPDIIPHSNVPVADPSKAFADFSLDYAKDVNVGIRAPNYIYVRGENLAQKEVNAEIRLYYSRAALLQWPTKWINNQIPSAAPNQKSVHLHVAAGEKVVANTPFLWVPEDMPTDDHYCLVGEVITADHPDIIPREGMVSVGDFAKWIATNRNLSWRNVNTVSMDAPTWSTSVEYEQGAVAEEVTFLLNLTDIPEGCAVAITSWPPGPMLQRTVVSGNHKVSVGTKVMMPANYSGTITYSFWQNPKNPIVGPASIELQAAYIPPANRTLDVPGLPAHELGLPLALYQHRLEEYSSANIGPVQAYPLGSFRTNIV